MNISTFKIQWIRMKTVLDQLFLPEAVAGHQPNGPPPPPHTVLTRTESLIRSSAPLASARTLALPAAVRPAQSKRELGRALRALHVVHPIMTRGAHCNHRAMCTVPSDTGRRLRRSSLAPDLRWVQYMGAPLGLPVVHLCRVRATVLAPGIHGLRTQGQQG